jgi:alkylated DNA repair dioxygenase AlkB
MSESSQPLSLPFLHLSNIFPRYTYETIYDEYAPYLRNDHITLENGHQYTERRQTCWVSESEMTFKYSNKVMTTVRPEMPPFTAEIRNQLRTLVGVYFDSVLINIYPDGKSGMHYHSDPLYDEWTPNSVVVSFGDTRTLIFRRLANKEEKHVIKFNNGDVVFMFDNCQELFDHCLKTEKRAEDCGPRISLVFKQKVDSTI